jgi:hypothetical protein
MIPLNSIKLYGLIRFQEPCDITGSQGCQFKELNIVKHGLSLAWVKEHSYILNLVFTNRECIKE